MSFLRSIAPFVQEALRGLSTGLIVRAANPQRECPPCSCAPSLTCPAVQCPQVACHGDCPTLHCPAVTYHGCATGSELSLPSIPTASAVLFLIGLVVLLGGCALGCFACSTTPIRASPSSSKGAGRGGVWLTNG